MSPMFQRSAVQKDLASRGENSPTARLPRHSSGWFKILAQLKMDTGLRILDIGPTSPNNINFLTNLGHSVYMADLVEEAVKPDWALLTDFGETPRYDTEAFLARHMDFSDRKFDIVLLWDALDYMPGAISEAILGKLAGVLADPGQILAFFHTRTTGQETFFCRYHVQDGETIQTQEGARYPVVCNYQNRQIEALFQPLGSCRFLLAKDNTREVIVSRA